MTRFMLTFNTIRSYNSKKRKKHYARQKAEFRPDNDNDNNVKKSINQTDESDAKC